jgi:PII-like signaling protein
MKRYIGKRKKLKIYIDSDDRYKNSLLWEAILKKAKEYGLAGATVYKAVAGMGAHSEIRSFNILSISQKLPLVIEIIDSHTKIKEFLNILESIIDEGLVTIEDVEVLSYKHRKFRQ